jgi:LSD1 subclass zinc finger protein
MIRIVVELEIAADETFCDIVYTDCRYAGLMTAHCRLFDVLLETRGPRLVRCAECKAAEQPKENE